MGNEHADQRAKNGAVIKSKPTKQTEMHKQINLIKHEFTHQQLLLEKDQLQNKSYQNIKDRTDLLKMLRKTAVALFRMETGHDFLAEHLHRTGCLQKSKCLLCKEDAIMNECHLSECKTLSGDNSIVLYWEVRTKIMQMN